MEQVKKSTITIILLQSFLFFGLLSVYFGKDNNWDLRNYHYYNAYAFLHNRLAIDYLPAQLQTFLNPAIDLPYYGLIQSIPPVAVGFIMGAIHGLNFWLIFLLTLRFCNTAFDQTPVCAKLIFALCSASTGVYGAAFLPLLGTATTDNLISIFVITSLLLVIKSGQGDISILTRGNISCLLLSGLIMGMAIGFKFTAAIYGLGMLCALPFLTNGWLERLKLCCGWSIATLSGVILTAGAWMMKMWCSFKNPVFPFFNRLFKSPYIPAVNFSDGRYFPDDWLQGLIYPFHFALTNTQAMEIPFRDARWAIIYVLVLVLISVMIYRRRAGSEYSKLSHLKSKREMAFSRFSVCLIIFFVSSYAIWQLVFSVYRYLVPIELLAPVTIATLLNRIHCSQKPQIFLCLLIFVGIIATVQSPRWERLSWKAPFFEIELPKIETPANTLIIVPQKKAWSYLFPYFHSSVRFVRVNTNLTEPGDDNKFQAEMSALLEQHTGAVYLLSNMIYELEDQEIISRYRLRMSATPAAPIKSRHELPGLMLRKLERTNYASDNSPEDQVRRRNGSQHGNGQHDQAEPEANMENKNHSN